MLRVLVTFALAAAAAAQIPYGHLVYVHSTPSTTVSSMGILDPDQRLATPIVPITGALSLGGTRSVAIDPAAPDVLYSITSLSTSVSATVPVYTLTGNRYVRSNLQLNLGVPGVPFHLRWATGFGLLVVGRGGQVNRMFLRDMGTGVVTPQPTATLLPNNSSDMAFLGGKAYATSEGNGTAAAVGTVVEWDLATNTDRVVGTGYAPIHAAAAYAGQLLVGDGAGNLDFVDPVTGALSPFLATGLGKIVSIAVDAQQRVFVVATNGTTWSVHDAFAPLPAIYISTAAIEDLEVGPVATATMEVFGSGCAGTNTLAPTLGFQGRPALGGSYGVEFGNGPAAAAVILALGSSRQFDGATPLPRDLAGLGMPGCVQYTNVLGTLFLLSSNTGAATATFTLPNNPAFASVRIPQQWVCLDPGANALGVTTSNGGEAYIW